MSIENYKDWKNGRKWGFTPRCTYDFWMTKPTYEQERLCEKRIAVAYFWGLVAGILLGVWIVAVTV